MKQELETLRAELHSIVDAKIDKLIKPEFKTNVWYKDKKTKFLLYPTKIKRVMDAVTGYGFNVDGEWLDECNDLGLEGCIEATTTEVQQALEKEFNKLYPKGSKVKCLADGATRVIDNGSFHYSIDTNYAYHHGAKVFENGQWAEIVKPMSLEDLGKDFNKFIQTSFGGSVAKDFKKYLTENKTQIIETLNNL